MAVAAASLVARKVFLEGLVRLSDEAGLDLPKGAGTPALDAARELQRTWGDRALERFEAVAKVHFRTTDRFFPNVRQARGWRSPARRAGAPGRAAAGARAPRTVKSRAGPPPRWRAALPGFAVPCQARSKAVPWSGLVRTKGSPRVTLTPRSRPSSLTGIRP